MFSIVLEHSDLVFLFAFMPDVEGGGVQIDGKEGRVF